MSSLNLEKLADLLLEGSVMTYPTDTIAGIGCIGDNKDAVYRVFEIKGRDHRKPVSYAFSSVDHIKQYAQISEMANILFTLLPGSLSLILPLRKDAPKLYGLDGQSIGVRIPDTKWLLLLIDKIKKPIMTTSANQTDKKSVDIVSDLDQVILDQSDILVEWDGQLSGIESTVVKVDDTVKILREGSIPSSKIFDLTT
ncbi:MAG: L-threonylcarbamoyladenylate synthase [Candidatus Kariarchaeaceae archaeon]